MLERMGPMPSAGARNRARELRAVADQGIATCRIAEAAARRAKPKRAPVRNCAKEAIVKTLLTTVHATQARQEGIGVNPKQTVEEAHRGAEPLGGCASTTRPRLGYDRPTRAARETSSARAGQTPMHLRAAHGPELTKPSEPRGGSTVSFRSSGGSDLVDEASALKLAALLQLCKLGNGVTVWNTSASLIP